MKYIRFNINKFCGFFSCCIYFFLQNEMNKNNLRIRNYNRYCIFVHSEEILVCEFQDRIDFLNISIFLIFNSGYHDFFH